MGSTHSGIGKNHSVGVSKIWLARSFTAPEVFCHILTKIVEVPCLQIKLNKARLDHDIKIFIYSP